MDSLLIYNILQVLHNVFTLKYLDQASDDDSNEGDDLYVGEEVLNARPILHIGTVHKGQQTYRTKDRMSQVTCTEPCLYCSVIIYTQLCHYKPVRMLTK